MGEQAEGQVDDGGGAAMTACSPHSAFRPTGPRLPTSQRCHRRLLFSSRPASTDSSPPRRMLHAHDPGAAQLQRPDRLPSYTWIPSSPPLLPHSISLQASYRDVASLLPPSILLNSPRRSWCEARPFRPCDILVCSSDHLAQASSPSLMHFDPIFTRRPWWPCPVV